ncbi:MAG: hypothetical protein K1X67_17290 [Fimbriimonadaceae bacterium]|nr:hypothetical protein [Fimbriimonadaceae bacterium]
MMIGSMSLVLAFGTLAASDPPQQGEMQGTYQGGSVQAVDRALGQYLNGEELKAILTPGDMCQWKLTLKAGQVVVGEARSEAVDPAIEIVDDQKKVMAQNDDRYPGDQRPLVFWRCTKDGEYGFDVRSFQNKAGGQVFARFNIYDSVDLAPGGMVEGVVAADRPFLVRIPMQAGQVKDLVAEKRGEGNTINFNFGTVINPLGLPERPPSLAAPIFPAIRALIAPLAGDYYLLAVPYGYREGQGRVRVGTRDFVPKPLDSGTAQSAMNVPALFELNVKKGDLIEATTPELSLESVFRVTEAPDFSKYTLDPKKPELNPFIPLTRNQPPMEGPALEMMPGRARDGRVLVFFARRDAKLWLATDGVGPAGKPFTVRVRPAAAAFGVDKPNTAKLRIANTDYWAFDGKAGDVMTLGSSASGFSDVVVVRDPDLVELRSAVAPLDQTSASWRMIVQKPGRYLVQVSALGDGGGGDYSLSRKVLPAKEFGVGTPAKGTIGPDEVQIWKFTATPQTPLFVRWRSSKWTYDVAIYDDKGNPASFQRENLDESHQLGILRVSEPRTFVIVLTGREQADYSIELSKITVGS